MSWEESKPELHECPCGSGQYIVVRRSDDWNRFDERWTMQCSECQKNFGLYTFETNRKGLSETRYGWAPRVLLETLEKLHEQIEAGKKWLNAYLADQHGSAWRRIFTGKSKKQIWSILTESGKRPPALPTFYSHLRHFGLETIVNDYLRYDEVELICRTLSIRDPEIDSAAKSLAALQKDVRRTEKRISEGLLV